MIKGVSKGANMTKRREEWVEGIWARKEGTGESWKDRNRPPQSNERGTEEIEILKSGERNQERPPHSEHQWERRADFKILFLSQHSSP